MISEAAEYLLGNSACPDNLGIRLIYEVQASIDHVAVTRHPLGFLHFDLTSLTKLTDGAFARLHIWDRQFAAIDPAGNIHDHTWELNSLILAGALRDRTFRPKPTAIGALNAVQVIYGSTNKFIDAGKFDLELVRDQEFIKGDRYYIPSRLVHESEPVLEPTVTFVVGIPDTQAKEQGPLIFSRDNKQIHGTAERERVSAEEASGALRTVMGSVL